MLTTPRANPTHFGYRAEQKGGTAVHRGEGLWLDGDRVVFTATTGEQYRLGQIAEIRVSISGNDSIQVLVEGDGLSKISGG